MSDQQRELEDVAVDIIGYRDSKGFHAATWDTLPIKLGCIYCEIEELSGALEAYSANRQSPYASLREVSLECADVAMYTLTILCDMFDRQWTLRGCYHGGSRALSTPSELTKPLRAETRGAFEHWRKGNRKDVMIHLELLLAALVDLRVRVIGLRSTLAADIRGKIANSANRPVLHGGKDPRS